MKTITNVDKVTISVSHSELIEGKWLYFNQLSKKLAEMEEKQDCKYKSLRNKLYNSRAGGKYNTDVKFGLPCINVLDPMKGKASLELSFKVV
jgi:hypothetical protein